MTFDACTLPTAERPLRRGRVRNPVPADPDEGHPPGPRHLRLILTGGDDLDARVRDLTAREQECCSFFTFTITTPAPDQVVLDIEVPASRTTVLDGLAALAARP